MSVDRPPQCGEPGYERCPECQAHRTEPHLAGCPQPGYRSLDPPSSYPVSAHRPSRCPDDEALNLP